MPTFVYNGEQLINVGDEIPIKLVKTKEKAMTAQEAIDMLRRMQDPEPWEPKINQAGYEALNMAISALEKQIPKKGRKNYKYYSAAWCDCGWYLGKQKDGKKYCSICGQAIDWAD